LLKHSTSRATARFATFHGNDKLLTVAKSAKSNVGRRERQRKSQT